MPTEDQKTEAKNPQRPGVVSGDLLGSLKMPKVRDVWVKPARRSPTAKLILAHAPKPDALKWYPDLPPIGAKIWAVWRNGKVGNAEYVGAWTYRASREYINEMPVAWHLA